MHKYTHTHRAQSVSTKLKCNGWVWILVGELLIGVCMCIKHTAHSSIYIYTRESFCSFCFIAVSIYILFCSFVCFMLYGCVAALCANVFQMKSTSINVLIPCNSLTHSHVPLFLYIQYTCRKMWACVYILASFYTILRNFNWLLERL